MQNEKIQAPEIVIWDKTLMSGTTFNNKSTILPGRIKRKKACISILRVGYQPQQSLGMTCISALGNIPPPSHHG